MRRVIFGTCYVPEETEEVQHGWLAPTPTVASWHAMRGVGIDEARIQLNASRVWTNGVFDPTMVVEAVRTATAAGMLVNLNYVDGDNAPDDPAWHEETAFRVASIVGKHVTMWTIGNELGGHPLMQPYADADNHVGFMRDYWFPERVLPFVAGVRRAIPNPYFGGCDADSAVVQESYIKVADELLHPQFTNAGGIEVPPSEPLNVCHEEGSHPYGELGGGNYAMRKEFDEAHQRGRAPLRPRGVFEIDHQQEPTALRREKDVIAAMLADGATPKAAADAGGAARGHATDEEIQAVIDFTIATVKDWPDCTRITYGNAQEYCFDAGLTPRGLKVSSLFLPVPVVSTMGRKFQAAHATINGPVVQAPTDRRRAVKK